MKLLELYWNVKHILPESDGETFPTKDHSSKLQRSCTCPVVQKTEQQQFKTFPMSVRRSNKPATKTTLNDVHLYITYPPAILFISL